jgi:hypothetical protein
MENIIKAIKDNIQGKKNLAEKLRKYVMTENEVLTVSMDNYSEYFVGILIKDVTTPEQSELGITILHLLANREIDFSLHLHSDQSQTISVKRGKIVDLENQLTFEVGESFFVRRNKNHRLKYYPGTELLIVYMPALKEVKH